MRHLLRRFLRFCIKALTPKPDITRELQGENLFLKHALEQIVQNNTADHQRRDYWERISELIEARQMAGSGPWRVSQGVLEDTDRLIDLAASRLESGAPGVRLRETVPSAQGSTGDIELALQNVEWRREVNLSWLEFSRWGIQQIILISRLQYIKHPMIQRGINVTANYVFGRGVDVMSEDETANDTLKEFFERNKRVLGQAALADLHKRLQYDGQIFYVFFADKLNSGKVSVRTIDATEIFEIITDPDDTDEPHFYHRKWSERVFSESTGAVTVESREAYYPALNWEPATETPQINGHDVKWDSPVLMQKGGIGISKWMFDTPKAYAALDWAKNARRLLETDLSTRFALSQVAMTLTTKGGQAALQGAKQQIGTSVGPTSNLWDQNPAAVAGSTFASGTGTSLAAFDTRGAIRNPSDVKEYRNMVAIVFEIPPTFLGDMETSNLATATTLDRPTELAMIEKQERWRETLITISAYVLKTSAGAASGRLKEAKKEKHRIVECARRRQPNGTWVYEKSDPKPNEIQLKCNFPAILEGDIPALVKSITDAMTLGNRGGQIVGIDLKAGLAELYKALDVQNWSEILEKQLPDGEYDPDRTKAIEPPPIPTGPPNDPGGKAQLPGGKDPAPPVKESRLDRASNLLERALATVE